MYFSDVKICSDPIWPTHFLSVHLRTPVTVKQTYYQSSYIQSRIVYNEMRDFHREIFYRMPNCLEQLLPSSKHFGNNTFSSQLLPEDKYFFSTATVSEEHFFQNKKLFRVCTFSMRCLFWTATFSEEEPF